MKGLIIASIGIVAALVGCVASLRAGNWLFYGVNAAFLLLHCALVDYWSGRLRR